MAHEHVEIKAGGNAEAAAAFQEHVKEGGIVENLVAGILVGEEFDEAFRRPETLTEHLQNEFNILSRELHPAVGLNYFHHFLTITRDRLRQSGALLRPFLASLQKVYSINSSKQRSLTTISNWIKI
jgi:hypothetical protein